jgi:RND family efflux transporter MFP subunit
MRRAQLQLSITVFLAVAGLSACTDSSAQAPARPEAPPRAVVAHAVSLVPATPERSFVGVVRPRVESDLGFRVSGKVSQRLVQQGDRVSAGQVLARLDATDLMLQREQAEAELRAAGIAHEASAAQDARTQELRRNGWATQATLDQQLSRTADALSRLDRAGRALELARNQQQYTSLIADTDGVVTATMIEPGQVVAAGNPVIRLSRSGERDVVVAVPEALIERVRTGEARVTLWSRPGERFEARLREFAAAADPATRTFQARFALSASDEIAAIGLTATVVISTANEGKLARIPVSALFSDSGRSQVFSIAPSTGSLSLKPVDVAGYDGRDALVGGLVEGEQVVAFGVQKLDRNERVRVVDLRR